MFIHVCEHSSLSNPVLHPCLGILIYYVSHRGFRHTHTFVQSHSFQLISASIFGSGFSPSLAVETNILPPAGCLGPTGSEKPGAGPRICPPSPQPGCVCVCGGGVVVVVVGCVWGGGGGGGRGAMCRSVSAGGFGALLTGLLLPRSPGVSGFPNRTSLVPLRAGPVPGCQEVTVPFGLSL